MMCCGTRGAWQAEDSNSVQLIGPFMGTTLISSAKWGGSKHGVELTLFRVLSLASVKSGVFAIAGAECKAESGVSSCEGITSRRLNLSGVPMEISMAGNSVPFAQLLEGVATTDGKEAAGIMRPTTVVSGGNTDMPPGNYGKTNSDTQPADASNWILLPVKGTATGEGANNKIRWSGTHAVKREAGGRNNSLRNLIGAGGSGVAFHDGTVVFPMRATDEDGKSVLLAMQFTSLDNKWRLSYGTTDSGCRDPSVVERRA
ncbi:trans-sialidase, putative [Trypanosoma cruzi marinkellei]|uniref:Trans-sialidase, putative n=1 Tax=Trypanosoma cruzi marinkellei TaxID=85056 RepID=K2M353_TRYCR|nr:trans-sialidase, putative [Trypanosoma cruzi marinkellei]